jgi:hypothetical protein
MSLPRTKFLKVLKVRKMPDTSTWDIWIATVAMPKNVKLSSVYFNPHTMKVYGKVEV